MNRFRISWRTWPSPADLTRAALSFGGSATAAALAGVAAGVNGATGPSLGTRTPELEHELGSFLALAIVIAASPVGMFLASTVVGRLADRLGTRPVAQAGAVAMSALGAVGFVVDSLPLATAAMLVLGIGYGLVDTPIYRSALWYEREHGKGTLTSQGTHAGYALGSLSGSVTGFAAVAAGVDIRWHLLVVGVLAAATIFAIAALLPNMRAELERLASAPQSIGRSGQGAIPPGLRPAAMAAGAATTLVDIGNHWGSVLVVALGASHAYGALAGVAYTAGTAISRLAVQHRSRTGLRRPEVVGRYGGIVGTAGMLLVAIPGRPLAVVAGMFVVGVGLGAVAPLAGSVADRLSTGQEARGVGLTQRWVYGGLVLGQLVIGAVTVLLGDVERSADTLRWALGSLIVCPILIFFLAPSLRDARSGLNVGATHRKEDAVRVVPSSPKTRVLGLTIAEAELLRLTRTMINGGRADELPRAVAEHVHGFEGLLHFDGPWCTLVGQRRSATWAAGESGEPWDVIEQAVRPQGSAGVHTPVRVVSQFIDEPQLAVLAEVAGTYFLFVRNGKLRRIVRESDLSHARQLFYRALDKLRDEAAS